MVFFSLAAGKGREESNQNFFKIGRWKRISEWSEEKGKGKSFVSVSVSVFLDRPKGGRGLVCLVACHKRHSRWLQPPAPPPPLQKVDKILMSEEETFFIPPRPPFFHDGGGGGGGGAGRQILNSSDVGWGGGGGRGRKIAGDIRKVSPSPLLHFSVLAHE